MTDILLCRELMDYLTLEKVTEVNTTIQSVHKNVILLTDEVSPEKDVWFLRVMEVTSGPAQGLSQVIAESAGNQLILSSPFFSIAPQQGDTVRLWNGPLADARIYQDEPDSMQAATNDGIKYFVSVVMLTGDQSLEGLGGRMFKGTGAAMKEFGISVIVETLNMIGTPSAADVFRAIYSLPVLKEQALIAMYAFRNTRLLSQNSNEAISWVKVVLGRPGMNGQTNKGYKLDMDIRFR